MKIIDVNLLLYAYDQSSPLHARASKWLAKQFDGSETTGISTSTALAFLRMTTNSRIIQQPFAVTEALDIIDEWFDRANAVLLLPTPRHWALVRRIAIESQARGNLIPDTDLAATAIDHGATLCTHDRDFMRFVGLRIDFPLSV